MSVSYTHLDVYKRQLSLSLSLYLLSLSLSRSLKHIYKPHANTQKMRARKCTLQVGFLLYSRLKASIYLPDIFATLS